MSRLSCLIQRIPGLVKQITAWTIGGVLAVTLTSWLPAEMTAFGALRTISQQESTGVLERTAPAGEAPSDLKRLVPHGVYVVVDTARNRLYLKRGEKTLYTVIVSTGSGARLIDPRDPSQGWRFDTPHGVFTITSKLLNPVWNKPDWAFLEEGQPVPTESADRIESGVLGQYALGFGDGYFIHGTLYTRLLGTNVTHGCIRLGDEDLRHVFHVVPIGATVIIF
jgi:L,D-transpeptidase YbiS